MDTIRIVENESQEIARVADDRQVESERMDISLKWSLVYSGAVMVMLRMMIKIASSFSNHGLTVFSESALAFLILVCFYNLWICANIYKEASTRILDLEEQQAALIRR